MLYHVSSCDFDAQPMPQGLWRDFLTLEHVKSTKGGNSEGSLLGPNAKDPKGVGDSSPNTRSSKHRQNALDFLQSCLNAAEGVELVSSSSWLEWNGRTLESPNDLEREEILWELAELNFRFELQALDSCATTAEPRSDRQHMFSMWYGGSSCTLGSRPRCSQPWPCKSKLGREGALLASVKAVNGDLARRDASHHSG